MIIISEYRLFKGKVKAALKTNIPPLTYKDLAKMTTYSESTIRLFMNNNPPAGRDDSSAVAKAIAAALNIEL